MLFATIAAMLDYLGKQLKSFVRRKLDVALTCAFAASLCVSLLFYLVSTASSPFSPSRFLKYTLITFSCYTCVALLLHKFWIGTLNRILPLWIPIAVWGSLLNEVIGSIGWLPQALNDPYFRGASPFLGDAFWNEIEMMRSVFLVHSLITLPVTGLIYYSGAMVRAVRNWHNRPAYVRSICEIDPEKLDGAQGF
jgi:hypothetical protein